MMKKRATHLLRNSFAISLFALLIAVILSVPVFAGEPIGTVTHLSGPLFAKKSDGTTKVLAPKSVVEEGDILVTEKNTYARVKFTDGGDVTLRPDSQLAVEEYAFEQGKPEKVKATFNLTKGGLRSITGKIGKMNPEQYKTITPNGVVGIRGTIYELKLCSGNCGSLTAGLYLFVSDGAISIKTNAGIQHINTGQYAYVQHVNAPPVILPGNPGLNFSVPPAVAPPSSSKGAAAESETKNVNCTVR